jgi:Protein of unknown function (DUF3179)
MRLFLFVFALIVLLAAEILRVYFIMPFPGSQRNETIEVAYFIGSYISLFRIAGLLLIAYPTYYYFVYGNRKIKVAITISLVACIVVAYLFNFHFLADKVFSQPKTKLFLSATENKVKAHQLVLGIDINGQAKAYAIEIIGYHHQVRDTVGGEPVMVTYCTVCRTGRVYAPQVDGIPEDFRLVGMDHFNAMFEDSRTKSWWRQANGEAVVGPLKGKFINEIPSEQMRLDAWINQHPNTLVMQPDSLFIEENEGLKNYDEGKSTGELTKPDSLSWKDKSWVVGVPMGLHSKAYDWNDLTHIAAFSSILNFF